MRYTTRKSHIITVMRYIVMRYNQHFSSKAEYFTDPF